MEFRERIIKDFAIIFNGTEQSDTIQSTDEQFAEKWNWFGVMYRLANGKIVDLEKVTKLNLLECFTWLSYETDLNLTKSAQRDDQQQNI